MSIAWVKTLKEKCLIFLFAPEITFYTYSSQCRNVLCWEFSTADVRQKAGDTTVYAGHFDWLNTTVIVHIVTPYMCSLLFKYFTLLKLHTNSLHKPLVHFRVAQWHWRHWCQLQHRNNNAAVSYTFLLVQWRLQWQSLASSFFFIYRPIVTTVTQQKCLSGVVVEVILRRCHYHHLAKVNCSSESSISSYRVSEMQKGMPFFICFYYKSVSRIAFVGPHQFS